MSHENRILFCQMWSFLNLISVSKSVDICFIMLQQFSKSGIQNSLKNSNNFLICFIAISVCTLRLCNYLQTKFTARSPEFLTLHSGWRSSSYLCKCTRMGSRDGQEACLPQQCRCSAHTKALLSPRDITASTATASASSAAMATANLGPDSKSGCPRGTQVIPDCPRYMQAMQTLAAAELSSCISKLQPNMSALLMPMLYCYWYLCGSSQNRTSKIKPSIISRSAWQSIWPRIGFLLKAGTCVTVQTRAWEACLGDGGYKESFFK